MHADFCQYHNVTWKSAAAYIPVITGPANDPNVDLAKPLPFEGLLQNWMIYFLKAQFNETYFICRLAVVGAYLILALDIPSPSMAGQPVQGIASPQQHMHLLMDPGMLCCPSAVKSDSV